jgi:hypothetical protein
MASLLLMEEFLKYLQVNMVKCSLMYQKRRIYAYSKMPSLVGGTININIVTGPNKKKKIVKSNLNE